MDHESALNRYGIILMAASLAVALFVATQAIAASAGGAASAQPAHVVR